MRAPARAGFALAFALALTSAADAHAGPPVITPDRQDEVVSLFGPVAPGGEVLPGWRLQSVQIDRSTIDAYVVGEDPEVQGRVRLGPPSPGNAPAAGSFVVETHGPEATQPAMDAVLALVRANDDGSFWEGSPVPRERPGQDGHVGDQTRPPDEADPVEQAGPEQIRRARRFGQAMLLIGACGAIASMVSRRTPGAPDDPRPSRNFVWELLAVLVVAAIWTIPRISPGLVHHDTLMDIALGLDCWDLGCARGDSAAFADLTHGSSWARFVGGGVRVGATLDTIATVLAVGFAVAVATAYGLTRHVVRGLRADDVEVEAVSRRASVLTAGGLLALWSAYFVDSGGTMVSPQLSFPFAVVFASLLALSLHRPHPVRWVATGLALGMAVDGHIAAASVGPALVIVLAAVGLEALMLTTLCAAGVFFALSPGAALDIVDLGLLHLAPSLVVAGGLVAVAIGWSLRGRLRRSSRLRVIVVSLVFVGLTNFVVTMGAGGFAEEVRIRYLLVSLSLAVVAGGIASVSVSRTVAYALGGVLALGIWLNRGHEEVPTGWTVSDAAVFGDELARHGWSDPAVLAHSIRGMMALDEQTTRASLRDNVLGAIRLTQAGDAERIPPGPGDGVDVTRTMIAIKLHPGAPVPPAPSGRVRAPAGGELMWFERQSVLKTRGARACVGAVHQATGAPDSEAQVEGRCTPVAQRDFGGRWITLASVAHEIPDAFDRDADGVVSYHVPIVGIPGSAGHRRVVVSASDESCHAIDRIEGVGVRVIEQGVRAAVIDVAEDARGELSLVYRTGPSRPAGCRLWGSPWVPPIVDLAVDDALWPFLAPSER